MRFRLIFSLLAILAAPASAQNLKLLDPFTGSPYRVGQGSDPGWQYAGVTGGVTNTADVTISVASTAAGARNYLSALQVKNTSAVASEIVVKDGSTVIWRGHLSASMTAIQTVNFLPALRTSANAALNVAMVTTGTATTISAQGYTGP
jgi:hypothetical protein